MQTAILVLVAVAALALLAWFLYKQMRKEELEAGRAKAAKKREAGKEAVGRTKKGAK
jgi:cytochrome c-type biogenesis protein CcmH/NrfG